MNKAVPGEIPVIDISGLERGEQVAQIGKALHAASSGLGFLYVRGHGISQAAIDGASEAAYSFFRSPAELKEQVTISTSHRGWLRTGNSRMRDDVLPDLKESFVWGVDDDSADHRLRGRNRWPQFVPQLQPAAEHYFDQAHAVAERLMRGFAAGLNLSEDVFLRSCDRPLSRASFVYYPAQQAADQERFGVAPHTDFGVLTVLHQDNNGGLQVQDINGHWIDAPPIEGTLVVNVADLLSRWTGGAYKSTPHRVINTSGNERLSLVLAFDPNPETVIDARQVFGENYEAAEQPITCGDYLEWRFNKAFSYSQKAGSDG